MRGCKGVSGGARGCSTVHSLWYDFAASMWSRLSHVRRSARDSPRDASGSVCNVGAAACGAAASGAEAEAPSVAVRTDALLIEALLIGALIADGLPDGLPDALPTDACRRAARTPLAGSRCVGAVLACSVGSEALVCRLASARLASASASPPVPLRPSCTAETELASPARLRCVPPLSRTCRPEPAACGSKAVRLSTVQSASLGRHQSRRLCFSSAPTRRGRFSSRDQST